MEKSFLVTIEFATKRFNPYVLFSNVILQSTERSCFLFGFHIKNHVPFGMNSKKLNPNISTSKGKQQKF